MNAQFRKTDLLQTDTAAAPGAARIVIAVDGPAGSGKGTLARSLAERFGYAYLDTGALYRAVALATLEMGGDPSRIDDVTPALAIVRRNLTPELLASPALRAPDVSQAASKAGALAEVRLALLDFQRDFAKNPPEGTGGAVLDGRDIGTVVCPEADIKIFLTASAQERARRIHAALPGAAKSYEDVLAEVQERDARDTQRRDAPLAAANDAYVIDTTALTPAEVLEEAIAVVRARFIAAVEATP